MFDFQQKKKIRKVMYSRITMFILFVFVLLIARATYNIYQKEKQSAQNYAAVKEQYDSLNSEATMLQSQIDRLNTESGQEEEIRDKFSVAKPGETVVVLVDASNTGAVPDNANTSLWQKFIGLFK